MPKSVYQAVFPYPAEVVYHAVADLSCWQWRSDLAGLEILENGNAFMEISKNGSRTHFTITEKQIGSRYAFEMEGEWFTGQWLGEFSTVPGGTRVVFTEKIRMKRWPLRLIAPLCLPLKKMQKTYAIDLMIHLSEHAREFAARRQMNSPKAPELMLAAPSEAHEAQVRAWKNSRIMPPGCNPSAKTPAKRRFLPIWFRRRHCSACARRMAKWSASSISATGSTTIC